MFINAKMQTKVVILTFMSLITLMSMLKSMLSCVEHETRFITARPGHKVVKLVHVKFT